MSILDDVVRLEHSLRARTGYKRIVKEIVVSDEIWFRFLSKASEQLPNFLNINVKPKSFHFHGIEITRDSESDKYRKAYERLKEACEKIAKPDVVPAVNRVGVEFVPTTYVMSDKAHAAHTALKEAEEMLK